MKRLFFLLWMLISITVVAQSGEGIKEFEKAHLNSMQIPDRNAVDAVLIELKNAKAAGSEVFSGSHGVPVGTEEIDFRIIYLERIKELFYKCGNRDDFGQQLIATFPELNVVSNVKSLAEAFYPNEPVNKEKEKVRSLLTRYTRSISEVNRDLARSVWANSDEISIINGAGQFFGFNSIFNDFIFKSFGSLSERKLSSVSEVINIYGDMAYIQFYWVFDRKGRDGKAAQSRGRETLICCKVNDEWKIYHIHYSGMPRGLI